ncbi:tigger transposable element-derived 1-like [Pelobates cultripes]|uniref:Tigger transposable element-derived 1-like n=1 Tax=Pelobates cultripes TaxID=61616 RepID=A0AAD1QXG9_PELCU|nr:tigger transposable element-derived 1-like [Pelobates cultripes]
MKDCLTLLFCANASGDLKIKPLLIYHSENPRAFKKHKVNKEQLSILCRLTQSHMPLVCEVGQSVFWSCCQAVPCGQYPAVKAKLLMDNAPAHPLGLEEDLLEDFNFIKVMFLPPNTTPLHQPMDQQVISNFKKLYKRELFRRCFEMTDQASPSMNFSESILTL